MITRKRYKSSLITVAILLVILLIVDLIRANRFQSSQMFWVSDLLVSLILGFLCAFYGKLRYVVAVMGGIFLLELESDQWTSQNCIGRDAVLLLLTIVTFLLYSYRRANDKSSAPDTEA